MFLVEQNAFGALKLATRGYVMVNGNVTMSGTGKELLANPEVRAAYLEGGGIERGGGRTMQRHPLRRTLDLAVLLRHLPARRLGGLDDGHAPARRPGGRYRASSSILLLLGIAVRFIHHALFDGTMFSPQYYIVDTVILLVIGIVGYRYTRTDQMVTQYHWLYERASLLSWKPKADGRLTPI